VYGHGGIAPSWRGGNQPTPQLTWSRRVTRATRVAGWPRWVRGAPRSRAKGAGRPFFPFGAAMATSLGRIATPRGTCHGERAVLGRHGEVRGILISVLGSSRPSLYGSGRGRVSIARLAHPPSWCAPRRSLSLPPSLRGQIESTGGTRGPRRPKRLVVVTQGLSKYVERLTV